MRISLRVPLWLIGLALISPDRIQAQTTLLRVGTNSPSSAESVLFSIARHAGILFFVACEADEDIPYLIQYTGQGHLLTGSDYGHNDPAEQAHLVVQIKAREDLSPTLVEKILCDNPRQFYNV